MSSNNEVLDFDVEICRIVDNGGEPDIIDAIVEANRSVDINVEVP